MFYTIRGNVAFAWSFIFDHEVSPLKSIPDIAVRHYVLQILGAMWAAAAAIAVGSYTVFAASLLGHVALIGAAAITVATLATAANKPKVFLRFSGRRIDGEHE